MKSIIKMGVIPMAFLCLLLSCEYEEPLAPNVTQKYSSLTPPMSEITSKVELVNGLLSFENGEEFEYLVDLLDDGDEKWQDEILLKATGYTTEDLLSMSPDKLEQLDEQMESYENLNGFDGDYVFQLVEDELGIQSLRSVLAVQEDKFLAQAHPNWDENPDDHYIQGTAERALFNSKGEIRVGGKLYRFFPNGLIYEITDGSFETLNDIGESAEFEIYEAPNVMVYNTEVLEGERRDCRTWVRKKYSETYDSGNKKFRGILGHGSFIFSSRVYSTVKHYKWKRNRWKKSRALLKTKCWGSHGVNDPGNLLASCHRMTDFKTKEKVSFRRRISVRHQTMGLGFGKVKTGMVHGYHEANGLRKYMTLNF